MSEPTLTRDELFRLLAAHCAGQLNKEDAHALARALRDDRAARELYIQYMDLHAALLWERSSQEHLKAQPASAAAAHESDSSAAPSAWKWTSRRLWRNFKDTLRQGSLAAASLLRTRPGISISLAAVSVLAAVMLLGYLPAPRFELAQNNQNAAAPPADRVIAARISGATDCRWEDDSLPVGYGSLLYKGQRLRLSDGVAEITFSSGAVVLLNGPAEFHIDTPGRGTLRVGRLAAQVPRRAVGFAIHTQRSVATDLGTEFGVSVAEDGKEEIHVFSGRVDVTFPGSDIAAQPLSTGEAIRVEADEDALKVTRLSSQADVFIRAISPQGDTTVGPVLPESSHPPVTDGLTLWLAADGAIRLDNRGRVMLWGDMRAGGNTKTHNAWQNTFDRRPTFAESAIAGRPAVRFDGNDFLMLATPSDLGILGSDYEMFLVARTVSPLIQFLIAGGVEDFEIHLNGEAGARFIPSSYELGQGASDLAANGAYSDGKPHLYAGRIRADGRGVLQVDGRDTADLTTGDARSVNNAYLRLGMRMNDTYGLQGDIAEVLIFRGALSDQQRAKVSDYLARKYAISLRP